MNKKILHRIALITVVIIAIMGIASSEINTIVSTAPSNTEILFALGLGDKVVGVTSYCNYPPEVTERVNLGNLTIIGGFSTINIEKIFALKPDLVLATGGVQNQSVEKLRNLNLTVMVLDPKNVSDILDNINYVGNITGKQKVAQELTDNMKGRIERIISRNISQKPRVFYLLWNDPLMSAGPGTFINDIIQLDGGTNLAEDAKIAYPVYSLETLIYRDPEVIIVNLGHGDSGPTVEWVKTQQLWQKMSAVKNNRVYGIDADIITRSGPRIVDALEKVARYIHPEFYPGDVDLNGIDDFELLDYIDLWAKGQVTDFDLLDAIRVWAGG